MSRFYSTVRSERSSQTKCGHWIDQDGQRHYYETQPTKTVQAVVENVERHRGILERIGEDTYRRFIDNLVCNPFRRDDWRRRL